MSVAATMTLDDQRPLMNSYEKMQNYNHESRETAEAAAAAATAAAVQAMTTASGTTTAGGERNNASVNAPLSAPASPSPSPSMGYSDVQGLFMTDEERNMLHNKQREMLCADLLQILPKDPQAARAFVSNVRELAERHAAAGGTKAKVGQDNDGGCQHQKNTSIEAIKQQLLQQQQQQQQQPAENVPGTPGTAGTTGGTEETAEQTAKLIQQVKDLQLREALLVRRMASQEKDYRENNTQNGLHNYKKPEVPSLRTLRTMLLDPAVNLMLQKTKTELMMTRSKLEETQNELSAWQFTPNTTVGKRLIAKCRLLIEENEELGKLTSNGRVAKLEAELSMQINFSEEVKKSQQDFDELMQDLDDDMDGMQTTISYLQQELKAARERIQTLDKECVQLKQELKSAPKEDVPTPPPTIEPVSLTTNGGGGSTGGTTGSNETINGSNIAERMEPNVPTVICQPTPTPTITPTTPPANPYNGGLILQTSPLTSTTIQIMHRADEANNRQANKRSYDEALLINSNDQPINMTTVRDIPAPRTLPPKKSKLRDLNARQNSAETMEIQTAPIDYTANEEPSSTTMTGIIANTESDSTVNEIAAVAAVAPPVPPVIAPPVVASTSASASAPSFPRIMTRRQSVRLQQNGSIDH